MTDIIRLTQSHLDRIITLHHAVIADADPSLVASETDAFFKVHLEDCGKIFGILKDTELLAYGVLGLPRPSDPNFGTDQHLPAGQLPYVAHIDGVAVRKDHRGHNWQQLLTRHRMEEARRAGRTFALTTVAPGNTASLINILSCGLSIHGLKEKYGGQRFLMRADLIKTSNDHAGEDISEWCPAIDFASCHRLLGAGYIGVVYRKGIGENAIELGWRRDHCM